MFYELRRWFWLSYRDIIAIPLINCFIFFEIENWIPSWLEDRKEYIKWQSARFCRTSPIFQFFYIYALILSYYTGYNSLWYICKFLKLTVITNKYLFRTDIEGDFDGASWDNDWILDCDVEKKYWGQPRADINRWHIVKARYEIFSRDRNELHWSMWKWLAPFCCLVAFVTKLTGYIK